MPAYYSAFIYIRSEQKEKWRKKEWSTKRERKGRREKGKWCRWSGWYASEDDGGGGWCYDNAKGSSVACI